MHAISKASVPYKVTRSNKIAHLTPNYKEVYAEMK